MFNIVVGVGPKQKTFTVYNDVIIPRSEFFRAARSNTWIKDDPTRPTSLEHEDPETFAAYLHAVNYDRIRIEGLHVYETGYFEENAAFVEELHGDVKKQEPSYPARYCANWKPSQGQHRYHTGPGTEGEESAGSSDRGHREKRQRV
jgi:hypothetical protein